MQAGEDISLHCQADGYPTPVVTWRKFPHRSVSLRSLPGDGHSFNHENCFASLTFRPVTPLAARWGCTRDAGKAVGASPGEYKEFLYEPNVSQFGNGSLHFKKITKDAQGHFLCEARNNIGAGVSKVIFLKVNGEPLALLWLCHSF